MSQIHNAKLSKTKHPPLIPTLKKQNPPLLKTSHSTQFATIQKQKLKTVEQTQKPFTYLPPFVEQSLKQAPSTPLNPEKSTPQQNEGWWAMHHVTERVVGALRVAGGTAEAAAGAGLGFAASWTGIGAVAGGAIFLHGSDVAATGLRQLYSGKNESSLTSLGLQKAGISTPIAENIDTSISIVGTMGASAIESKLAQKVLTQETREALKTSGVKTIEYASKAEARAALEGLKREAANRFFKGATAKSINFKVIESNELTRFEFFSPANNPGYGKLYVQEIDDLGKIIREFKETWGPQGLIETKVVH